LVGSGLNQQPLKAGIGSDVPMLALELLEGVVTMEEADAIHEAFPSI